MWGAGFATGIGVGFGLGLVIGSLALRQKPWSELNEKEKKTRKIAIGVGSFLLLLGIAALVWALLSRLTRKESLKEWCAIDLKRQVAEVHSATFTHSVRFTLLGDRTQWQMGI